MQQIAIRFRTFFADECSFIGIADTVVRAEFQRNILPAGDGAYIPRILSAFVDRLVTLLPAAAFGKSVFFFIEGKTHSGQPIFDLAVNAG